MILHRSNTSHSVTGRTAHATPRARIGMIVLAAIVAMLALLNLTAGVA